MKSETTNKTIIGAECDNRNHDGLTTVMHGNRLPDDTLGQDAAFIAFLLGEYEALVTDLERQVEHFAVKNAVLRGAIMRHRSAQGHNLCHENDTELYSALEDGITVDHTAPPRCEFREKCREYYESLPGAEKAEDGW